MTNVEATEPNATVTRSERAMRLVLLCLCLLLFSVGYGIAVILSLPFSPADDGISLLFAVTTNELFSLQTLVLLAIATRYGRPFDRPSPLQGHYLDFPSWVLKQPLAGTFLGLTILITPLLIIIGLSGIAYVLAAAFVLYGTPRLLSHGLAGAALLMIAWAFAGFFLAQLMFSVPKIETCEDSMSLELRSGRSIPCDDFFFLKGLDGFVFRNEKTSAFVKTGELASSSLSALGMHYRLLN